MLNPSTDKYTVEFSQDFYKNIFTQKYDDYLFVLNGPVKHIHTHIHESIQTIDIPGINLSTLTVAGLNNLKNQPYSGIGKTPRNAVSPTVNLQYPGNNPVNEVIDSTVVNMTFRNTILNWMYIYEVMRNHYERSRTVPDFSIMINVMDAAENSILQFIFSGCFVAQIPGLSFSFNNSFRETKTIEAGFAFNKMDIKFSLPEFNLKKL